MSDAAAPPAAAGNKRRRFDAAMSILPDQQARMFSLFATNKPAVLLPQLQHANSLKVEEWYVGRFAPLVAATLEPAAVTATIT